MTRRPLTPERRAERVIQTLPLWVRASSDHVACLRRDIMCAIRAAIRADRKARKR